MLLNLHKVLNHKNSLECLSRILNVSEKVAQDKLNETIDFTVSEVMKINKLYPDYSIDYLFKSINIDEAEIDSIKQVV